MKNKKEIVLIEGPTTQLSCYGCKYKKSWTNDGMWWHAKCVAKKFKIVYNKGTAIEEVKMKYRSLGMVSGKGERIPPDWCLYLK